MSATSPVNAARTTGVVNTSRVASIIIRISAEKSPAGASSALGAIGNAASCTNSALLDHRRYSADLRGSGPLGDGGQAEIRIADFHKQFRGRRKDGRVDARIPGPSGTGGLVKVGRVCFHNATYRIVIAPHK